MADHSPSAVARILEGVFTPFRENSHPNFSSIAFPLATCLGDGR
jgi:hypothetical protein